MQVQATIFYIPASNALSFKIALANILGGAVPFLKISTSENHDRVYLILPSQSTSKYNTVQ